MSQQDSLRPPVPGRATRLSAASVGMAACALVIIPVAVLEWRPEQARWHAAAAAELQLDGRVEEAMARLNHAIQLDPDNAVMLAQRAALRMPRGPLDEKASPSALDAALRDVNRAVELQPGQVRYLMIRSEIQLLRGEGAAAVADCETMLERPSRLFSIDTLLNQLAYTRAVAQLELEKGLVEVEKALTYKPEQDGGGEHVSHINALDTRGYLHFLLGNDIEAKRDLNQAVEQFDVWIWSKWDLERAAKQSLDIRSAKLQDAELRHALAVMLFHRSLVNERLDPAAAERDRKRIGVLLPGYSGQQLH